MRDLVVLLLGLLLLNVAAASRAAEAPLYVEIVVNGQSSEQIVPLYVQGDRLLVAVADLRAAGVTLGSGEQIDVAHLEGLTARYHAGTQGLLFDVAPEHLPVTRLSGAGRTRVEGISDFGGLLNYDFFTQRSGGRTTASVWAEQRLFGDIGMLSNTGTLHLAKGGARLSTGYLRYDTRLRYADEGRVLAVTAGDLITRSLSWSSSVRLGGIQIGRDFSIRPDLVTMPLPSFAGETAVPSSVDLFIDGYRQQTAAVTPGRFVLDSVPVISGRGNATVVTTDAVGRQIRTSVPFYVAAELLKPGLTDYSAEIGLLRRGYGLKSFSYGGAAASGTLRRGLTQALTVEGHAEASRKLALAGAGLVGAAGVWGVFDLSVAASTSSARSGAQMLVGYSYSGDAFSFQVRHTERTGGFRDLGTWDLGRLAGTRSSDRALASLSLAKAGSLAAAYISQRSFGGSRARLVSLSYSLPLDKGWTLGVSADHDLRAGTTGAQLRLMVPFGRSGISVGATRDHSHGMLYAADYGRSVPSEGGLGLNASVARPEGGDLYGQGEATLRVEPAQAQVGMSRAGKSGAIWGSVAGSVAAMDRTVFVSNQVSDAFAVVSTGGRTGVPVYFENQLLGRTDETGHLFVPDVTAYQPSLFALDPLVLGVGDTLVAPQKRVAIRSGTGAIVRMPIIRSHAVSVPLVDEAGAPLAAGGRVRRADGNTAAIGWDGLVFLEHAEPEMTLDVTRRDGSACRAAVRVPSEAEALATLAPVICA